jgi:hypothetical protein
VSASTQSLDPYLHDPDHWGVSLAQMTELIYPCLDAVGARSLAEVGAFAGDLTRVLVSWAQRNGASVMAIDPAPQPGLVELAEAHSELELVRETSLAALPHIPLPDAIVIDGDHNYYTVSEELRLIGERTPGVELPLLFFHDVRWPHARRDDYFDVRQIPPASRHPTVPDGLGLVPGDPDVRRGGLPYPRSAAHEGGAGNGVLTAVEDFVAARDDVRLAIVPAFFGFGVAWHTGKPWSDQIAAILDSFDQHPVLERLEANRVRHLAAMHAQRVELWRTQQRLARQQAILQRLLDSSAFTLAEHMSRLRASAGIAKGQSVISKAEIRRALQE